MKQCLYGKCGKSFEPNKPKQRFCSAKCRVYWNRGIPKVQVKNLNQTTNEKKPPEQPKTNFVIDTEKISELEKELAAIPDKTKGIGKMMADAINKKILQIKYP